MRLFLDAHLSARRIARALREGGHDVHAADEDRSLDGWTDERLLQLATREGRIVVTCNVRDFARLARTWAESGRSHSGCVLLVGIDHGEFGLISQRLDEVLAVRAVPEEWQGFVVFVGRAPAAAPRTG